MKHGTTDIIVYGQGSIWRLQGATDAGLSWLHRNAGMPESSFSVTLPREEAKRLCSNAERYSDLLVGAAAYY